MAFTFSGPILQDRLFFFVGYEENTKSLPGLYGTKDSGAQNSASVVTTALANEIRQLPALGLFALLILGGIFSENIRSIKLRYVVSGILLQFILVVLLTRVDLISSLFGVLSDGVMVLKAANDYGTGFVFGYLADGAGEVRFNSFDDYKNGIWSRLRIHEPYAGHDAVGSMAADFEVEKTSMYGFKSSIPYQWMQEKRKTNSLYNCSKK